MLKFAIRNLMSRPVRSSLSLLGLTVAIAGMVGLFAVKGGLEKTVDDTFRLIPGLTVMQPGAPVPIFSKLPAKWEAEIADIDGVGVVNAQIIHRANVIDGEMTFNPPRFILGTDIPSRLKLERDVYREHMNEGRFLRLTDRGTSNAVISRQIARHFNKQVNETLVVDGQELTIVGIYHTNLPLLDVAILMDIEQVRRLTRFDAESVSLYYLEKSNPNLSDDELKRRIRETFRGRKIEEWRPATAAADAWRTGNPLIDVVLWILRRMALRTGGDNAPEAGDADGKTEAESSAAVSEPPTSAVEVRNADDWAVRLEQFSEDLDIFLTIMTGIGMSIALLSIINTMLMSVTERIIEFGILKANGWSRRNVLSLITLESGLIGLGGGVLGAVVGWGVTQALNSYWPEKVSLYASPALLGFSIAFSVSVGVLGGLYPAVWAMRMMPMEAIRRG